MKKTAVIPLKVRRSAVGLLERVDGVIPEAVAREKEVDDLNEQIDRRNAPARKAESVAEAERLSSDIEKRYQAFKEVDDKIRAVVADLRDLLLQLPDHMISIRTQIERLPLLKAVECSLQVNKRLAVRDLNLIRNHLADILGQASRPTPSEVVDIQRKALGLTVEALAARAGVSRNQIYAIKKGGNPTAETLRHVAAALGCEPGDLIQPAERPAPRDARQKKD